MRIAWNVPRVFPGSGPTQTAQHIWYWIDISNVEFGWDVIFSPSHEIENYNFCFFSVVSPLWSWVFNAMQFVFHGHQEPFFVSWIPLINILVSFNCVCVTLPRWLLYPVVIHHFQFSSISGSTISCDPCCAQILIPNFGNKICYMH